MLGKQQIRHGKKTIVKQTKKHWIEIQGGGDVGRKLETKAWVLNRLRHHGAPIGSGWPMRTGPLIFKKA